MVVNIFHFLILLSLSFYLSQSADRLVFLYTHFRHGARAPLAIDNNFYDKLGEKWTNPGELTGVGQRMHYILGLRNRLKYVNQEGFLSPKFDPHEILIFSSNFNRTMVSVSSQLQGLYPQSAQPGEVLTDEQLSIAYPQVNVDNDEIKEEILSLNNSALPYQMTLAPVRMVNDNDRKMNVYDLDECVEEREDIKKKNIENIPEINDYVDGFNEKYKSSFNNYFNDSNKTYSAFDLNDICDAFLSNYWDDRNMTDFRTKSGLNFTQLNIDCFEFFRYYYLYSYHGDKEKALAHVDSSKIMNELIYYMKRRIDADITEENEDGNYRDYSRPKMVMRSGHDSTVSADVIFLVKVLGLNEESIYTFPKYASQLALEVRTDKDISTSSSYSDYYVKGFFDDKEIFNVNANEFINGVGNEIWSEEKVNNFCGFDEESSSSSGNSTNSDEDKSDKAKTAYKVLMSVFICLTAILLATTIFLGYKLSKANAVKPPLDQTGIKENQSNFTKNALK